MVLLCAGFGLYKLSENRALAIANDLNMKTRLGLTAQVAALTTEVGNLAPQIADLQAQITGLRTNLAAVPKDLICEVIPGAVTAAARGPVAEVYVEPAKRADYVVTGGGCEMPEFAGHNPPIIASIPLNFGWRCVGGDPPNIPLTFKLRAYAIACRAGRR